MAIPLRALIVEDSPDDAALLLRELRRAGYEPDSVRVDTAEGLREALATRTWDVVFSDYVMPSFSAPAALEIVKASGLDLPFIILSGTVGEETAVEAMRAGAHDYLMKGRLARLVPALRRELLDAEARRARLRAERAVDRSDAILQAVLGAAEQLLRGTEWESSIQEVLAGLGRALEVSRIYIFENQVGEDGELLTSQRHEWVAPAITPHLGDPDLRGFSWRARGLGRWEELLGRGETLHGAVHDLPPDERGLLVKKDIRSFALVPIFRGRSWWGLIGFEECGRERAWSTAELDALRTAAGTLGAAIQRRQVEEEVERQVRRLAGLRAINVAITASLDLEVTLNVFLDHATAQLGVDAADVLLLRPQSATLEFAAGRGFRAAALKHTRLRVGEGYAGRAALERRSLGVPDLRREPGGLARASFSAGEAFVAYHALPLLSKGQVKGVLELFHRSALDPTGEWLEFAYTLAGQAAVAIDNALLFEELQTSNLDLTIAYDTTLEGWSRAMDLRDRETEGHTQRVTQTTLLLARELGIPEPELVHVRRGSLLHDIGKMGIPDRILLKPGPLTDEEWEVMRLHPVYAYQLLSPIPYLRPALDIPYAHHERWDGTGYPRGLAAEAIPAAARAFAVVDVWDALRSDRPYRPPWSEDRVRTHVRGLAGTHFDPRVVQVFLNEVLPLVDSTAARADRSASAGPPATATAADRRPAGLPG